MLHMDAGAAGHYGPGHAYNGNGNGNGNHGDRSYRHHTHSLKQNRQNGQALPSHAEQGQAHER